jgi:hypothetical protein
MLLHVVVDAASPGLFEDSGAGGLCKHAHRVVRSRLPPPRESVLALTVLSSSSTSNCCERLGSHYEHINTVFGPEPCSSAAVLDRLKELSTSNDASADVFSALVVAVCSLSEYPRDELERREGAMGVLLLCDASRYAQDEVDEEHMAEVVEQMVVCGMRVHVASTSPLPDSGVLRTLCTSLGGRFEFLRIKGGGEEEEEEKEEEAKREAKREACAEQEDAEPDEPAEERRVDASDGNAYTRDEFIGEYGGTDEWECAVDAATYDLARSALRAHAAWSQLEQQRKELRAMQMTSADKCVREATAAQFAGVAPADATRGEAMQVAADGEEDQDAFADWDLPSGVSGASSAAKLGSVLAAGAAFLVTGALAPADHAEARGLAAVARAAASGDAAMAEEEPAETAPAAAAAAPPTCGPLFGEADEFNLADATASVPMQQRHLTLDEAAALRAESRPPTRLLFLAKATTGSSSGGAEDESILTRLLDLELPFARVLLFLSAEEATLLATGTSRAIRQQAAPLYNRYCRVVVRRLEAEARRGQREAGSSHLVPRDAVPGRRLPSDGPDGVRGEWDGGGIVPADGIAEEVWAEVRPDSRLRLCSHLAVHRSRPDDLPPYLCKRRRSVRWSTRPHATPSASPTPAATRMRRGGCKLQWSRSGEWPVWGPSRFRPSRQTRPSSR